MKKIFFIVFAVVFFSLQAAVLADEPVKEQELSEKAPMEPVVKKTGEMEAAKPLAERIIGTWTIAPNVRTSAGKMIFKADGTYEIAERYHDGTGAETRGEFSLDETVTPARLKLCLGECNKPGAELVTRFCILKCTAPNVIELYQSLEGSFPEDFPEDKNTENFMVLTR